MNAEQIERIEGFISEVENDLKTLKNIVNDSEQPAIDLYKFKIWAFRESFRQCLNEIGLSLIVTPDGTGYAKIGKYDENEERKFEDFLNSL